MFYMFLCSICFYVSMYLLCIYYVFTIPFFFIFAKITPAVSMLIFNRDSGNELHLKYYNVDHFFPSSFILSIRYFPSITTIK